MNPPPTLVRFEGMRITRIRMTQQELIVSLDGPAGEMQLICSPEAINVGGEQGKREIRVTGIKYEIGTGPATILTNDVMEFSGQATEILNLPIVSARHDPTTGIFALGIGQDGQYTFVVTPFGLKVTHTTELKGEWKRPLVLQ